MTREEFNKCVRQMSRMLYIYAFRFVNNREEAEDVVQEVFIRMWSMGNKLDGYNSLDALATTMTRNYCIDILRKQKNLSMIDNSFKEVITDSTPQELIEKTESGIIIKRI